jgi:hypothetical protein
MTDTGQKDNNHAMARFQNEPEVARNAEMATYNNVSERRLP